MLVNNDLWAGAGLCIGYACGMAVNVWNNRAIFHQNNDRFKSLGIFDSLNRMREKEFHDKLAYPNLSLFSPLIPAEHLIPMYVFTAWNIGTFVISPGQTFKTVSIFALRQVIENIVFPNILSVGVIQGGFYIRSCSKGKCVNANVDVSGHAIAQSALVIRAIYGLQALSAVGTAMQVRSYSIIVGLISVTDSVWGYHTAANCHSVADMVTGVACAAIPFMGIIYGRKLVVNGIAMLIFKTI